MNIHLTKMGENEVIERFVEGVKKASDRLKQISKRPGDDWHTCSLQLDQLAINGRKLFDQKAMTPGEVEKFIDGQAAQILKTIESENISETDKILIKNSVQ